MEKLLLHICCAPCSIVCIDTLRTQGIEPIGFWYNPNIHPFTEYKQRKNTLRTYAEQIGLHLIVQEEYGLRRFVEGVSPDFENRCAFCYQLRFDQAARYAAENGFSAFTSTLFVSPYQNHALMRQVAQAAAAEHGVLFADYDFSPRFREGQTRAHEQELYMQKYCGCIFSEEDRYCKKK